MWDDKQSIEENTQVNSIYNSKVWAVYKEKRGGGRQREEHALKQNWENYRANGKKTTDK